MLYHCLLDFVRSCGHQHTYAPHAFDPPRVNAALHEYRRAPRFGALRNQDALHAGDGAPGLEATGRHGRLIPLVVIAPDHDRTETGLDARRRAELPVIGARRHALCPLLRRFRRRSRNRDRHDRDGANQQSSCNGLHDETPSLERPARITRRIGPHKINLAPLGQSIDPIARRSGQPRLGKTTPARREDGRAPSHRIASAETIAHAQPTECKRAGSGKGSADDTTSYIRFAIRRPLRALAGFLACALLPGAGN